MNLNRVCYEVGPLLYSPATNKGIATSVIEERFGKLYSLALCLEDAIADDSVEIAEKQLIETLNEIMNATYENEFYMPKIFIRVREPKQLERLFERMEKCKRVVTGFIFPKYQLQNADQYNDFIKRINKNSEKIFYMMPILESKNLIDISIRKETLLDIKEKIDEMKRFVLNVRVGGNDFCNEFAARRHYDQMIYDIIPISQLLGDILTVFAREYVVSGPVWEFFSSDNEEWKTGLKRELSLDKLNGFVGKTVIHPKQIAVVNDTLKVSKKDYEDAQAILQWDENNEKGVSKSCAGERMNEVKTHGNWAVKILILADIYGIN